MVTHRSCSFLQIVNVWSFWCFPEILRDWQWCSFHNFWHPYIFLHYELCKENFHKSTQWRKSNCEWTVSKHLAGVHGPAGGDLSAQPAETTSILQTMRRRKRVLMMELFETVSSDRWGCHKARWWKPMALLAESMKSERVDISNSGEKYWRLNTSQNIDV